MLYFNSSPTSAPDLGEYERFPWWMFCSVSTGLVIMAFVFKEVSNGLRLVALNARVGFLKYNTEVCAEGSTRARSERTDVK